MRITLHDAPSSFTPRRSYFSVRIRDITFKYFRGNAHLLHLYLIWLQVYYAPPHPTSLSPCYQSCSCHLTPHTRTASHSSISHSHGPSVALRHSLSFSLSYPSSSYTTSIPRLPVFSSLFSYYNPPPDASPSATISSTLRPQSPCHLTYTSAYAWYPACNVCASDRSRGLSLSALLCLAISIFLSYQPLSATPSARPALPYSPH